MKNLILILSLITLFLGACNVKSTPKEGLDTKDNLDSQNNTDQKYEAFLESEIKFQDFDLYILSDLEVNSNRKVSFISLSESYQLSDHKDSLAIPNLNNITDKNELEYFYLNKEYRKRMLEKTGISESDSLFLYDYANNILLTFLIKNLKATANLSIYSIRETYDEPLTQYDYEIGFEIDNKLLNKLEKYRNLVYIGKENPFARGQMKAIKWKKIENSKFPKLERANLTQPDSTLNSYLYDTEKFQIYIQDLKLDIKSNYVNKRHLIVLDKSTSKPVIERIFRESEGKSLVPLNFTEPNYSAEQWTGKLFKDKPEILFGFVWFSFGCPNIFFIDKSTSDIIIKCDNRH